jgi:hypothetical protein
MVAVPDQQHHTIKRGARPHIEANVFSVYETPHIPLNPNQKRHWIDMKFATHCCVLPHLRRHLLSSSDYRPQGRTNLLRRQRREVASNSTTNMAEELALGHDNVNSA